MDALGFAMMAAGMFLLWSAWKGGHPLQSLSAKGVSVA